MPTESIFRSDSGTAFVTHKCPPEVRNRILRKGDLSSPVVATQKKAAKTWLEVDHTVEFLAGAGGNKITYMRIATYPQGSPNPIFSSSLQFEGECEEADGELTNRRVRYDISKEMAHRVCEMIKSLEQQLGNRQIKGPRRECFGDIDENFKVSLKHANEKKAIVLCHKQDGWKFETDDIDRFFGWFAESAR